MQADGLNLQVFHKEVLKTKIFLYRIVLIRTSYSDNNVPWGPNKGRWIVSQKYSSFYLLKFLCYFVFVGIKLLITYI